MKRSLLSLIAVSFMAAATYVADRVNDAFEAVASCAVSAWRFVSDFALKVLSGPAPMRVQAELVARRHLLVSDAATLRQAKRERPRITGIWRMCPST